MNRQNEVIRNLTNTTRELRDKVIANQEVVVKLQDQLINSKDEQLQSLQATVTSSVQNTMKTELKSYSSAVVQGQAQTLAPDMLKAVVQTVVEHED